MAQRMASAGMENCSEWPTNGLETRVTTLGDHNVWIIANIQWVDWENTHKIAGRIGMFWPPRYAPGFPVKKYEKTV